eukprot:GHRR01029145.1.p2 GENE.GHRR01029145.1~~GHRR01029145.1.p2  ORF type:complete len:120 (-),score=44.77 GHRR01029145.1:372-731(-)
MVVASSEVVCVSVDDMPAEVLAKERKVEMGKEDLKSKPEAVRAKIVEGRLEKIKKNFSLLEQPSLRDNNKTVGELIKETIAATGENIRVSRLCTQLDGLWLNQLCYKSNPTNCHLPVHP